MKVKRYTYGATNVPELQAQREVALSPQEAAQAAVKPYETIGEVAGIAADQVKEYGLRKIKEEDEADTMASALNVSNYKNMVANAEKQAIAENWPQERYESEMDAINQAFAGSANLIGERNRPEIEKAYQNTMAAQALNTQNVAYGIRRSQQIQDYEAQRVEATQNGKWETVTFLDDMANRSGLIDDAEKLKLTAANEGQITAEGLMNDYREARANGTGDEFLLKVSKMDLSNEAQAAFGQQTSEYDRLTKELANEARQAKGLRTSNYYHFGITRSTTPADVTAFIRENKITDEGTMSKLYGRLSSVQNNESIVNSDSYNPAASADRKAFDALLPSGPDVTEREMFEASIGIAQQRNIVPKWIDGYFNRGAYNTDKPQEFAQVAEDYHSYVLLTDRLPVTITEEARARFEMYHDLRMAQTGSNIAAGLVLNSQKALTEDAFEANLAAFDDPTYGVDENLSPQETIKNLLTAKVESDFAIRMGLSLTEKGILWDSTVVPPIPPELRREMTRISRNMWAYTTNEEVAANAAFGSLRASGWQATDANKGITGPDGTKMGYQYMTNPPEKPFAVTRAEMGQSIEGIKFQIPGEYKEGTASFNWRTVDVNEIELGEGQVYLNEDKEQVMRWPLLINGEQLLSRKDDKTVLEFFEYGKQPRVNEETFLEIEKAHKKSIEESQTGSTYIDPELKF